METNILRPAQRRYDIGKRIFLLIIAIPTIYPFLFLVFSSFKSNNQFYENYWFPAFPLHLSNYTEAAEVLTYLVNSIIYSSITVGTVVIISALSGYAFSRFDFVGKRTLFLLLMLLITIPGMLVIVPLYSLMNQWRLLDTGAGLVLVWVSGEVVTGTFVMRTFFNTIPRTYFEAARIDGASEIRIFRSIALPMAKPALGTVAIIDLLFTWNDVPWPLVSMFTRSRFPVAVGMLSYRSSYRTEWGVLFAGYVIVSLPLIIAFFFAVDKFIEGLKGGIAIGK